MTLKNVFAACRMAKNAALIAAPLPLLLLGCGWILGLDEYSLQTSCPTAECGVFVSLQGSDSNIGTKEAPVRTISRAIEVGRPVRTAEMVHRAKGAEAGAAQRAKLGAAARAVEAAARVDAEEMAGSVGKPAGRASQL